MIDRFEKFTFTTFAIMQNWNKIAATEMEKYDLKGMYAIYLMVLYRNEGGITAAKLGEICHRDKAEISRSISILEEKELVVRENVSPSAYRALIKLTDAGREVAQFVCRRANEAVEAASASVSDADREIFYKVLGTISDNLKKISEDGLSK